MGDRLAINTDAIESARPGWYDLAYRIAGAVSQFQSVLSRVGTCQGNDSYGKQYDAQIGIPGAQVLSAAESAVPAAENTGDGLGTMATGFATTEENNRASIVSASDGPDSGDSDTPGRGTDG